MSRMFQALVVMLAMAAPSAQAKSLLDTASDAGTFNVFLAAIKAAGMTETLSGPGPYTIFAPSDDAFGKLPKATYEGLFRPENKTKLKELLQHHVVAGTVISRDVAGKRMEADALHGEPLLIDATRFMMVGEARVTQPDLKADNGILHVVDTVLMPK